MDEGSNKYFVNCPFCGRRVCKLEYGSKVEVECNSCKKTLTIFVRKGKIIIESDKIIKPIQEEN